MPAEVERADSTTGAGDVMLLYSDGLVKLRNRDDEEYSHDRLVTMSEALDAEVRSNTRRMAASCLAHLIDFAAGTPRPRRSHHHGHSPALTARPQPSLRDNCRNRGITQGGLRRSARMTRYAELRIGGQIWRALKRAAVAGVTDPA